MPQHARRSTAATLLRQEVESYAKRPREQLTQHVGEVDAYEVVGRDGIRYQVEVSTHWDAEPGGVLRVIGSIDDGGFRTSFSPVMDGFLMAEDGAIEMDPWPRP